MTLVTFISRSSKTCLMKGFLLALLLHENSSFSPIVILPKKPKQQRSSSTSTSLAWGPPEHQQQAEATTTWITNNKEWNNALGGGLTGRDHHGQEESSSSSSSSSLMKVVPPSSSAASDDAIAIELLHRIDLELRRRGSGVQLHLERLIALGNNSVRQIQAGRYEVFVQAADGKKTTAFDWIAAKVGRRHDKGELVGTTLSAEQVKDIILSYARRQAHASDIRYAAQNYQYHNFAILVNYHEVPAQYPHIDLQEPNAQFALIITPESPGTIWYEPSHQIKSARDYQQALLQQETTTTTTTTQQPQTPLDDDWVHVMDSNAWVRDKLQRFGNVLSPILQEHRPNGGAPLQTGALLSLPGGVVHAGPECSKFRAVMFFSGYPAAPPRSRSGESESSTSMISIAAPYNPDVQYFASILLSDILSRTWSKLTVPHRKYLLEQLVMYLTTKAPADNRNNMHKHLPRYSSMKEFVMRIEKTDIVHDKLALDAYLEQFASQEQLF